MLYITCSFTRFMPFIRVSECRYVGLRRVGDDEDGDGTVDMAAKDVDTTSTEMDGTTKKGILKMSKLYARLLNSCVGDELSYLLKIGPLVKRDAFER